MNTPRLSTLLALLLSLGTTLLPANARADAVADYPSRPIRFVVTYPPGGGTDFVARELGTEMGKLLGQAVVVDNRGGAGGTIGTAFVASAPADGYTLLFGTTAGLVINPAMRKKLPYDALKDFEPVSLLASTPQLLVVDARLPIRSMRELVAYARNNPGKLSYASVGSGAPNHIAMEMLKSMNGVKMVHVPYKGAGPAVNDMLGGQVQLMFNPIPPLLPHVKDGRFRALGVSTARRSSAAPDIPTVAEAGTPGFDANFWYSVFVPAGTPAPIVAKLNAAIGKVLADPAIRTKFIQQGVEPMASSPQELAGLLRRDTERMARTIEQAGITAE